ncbi:nitroreductase/quinone reductase family protein [Enemella sp. A6]|uniref:nitroreductase/quinone reductase family protein n=1 Tax=Enemella sp. A6 TaxID=3440152 RepID=UPI003EBEB6C6
MQSPTALWHAFNQSVMIPALRSPVGRFLHSPLIGYTAVLNTTGRRSGRTRAVPLSYALRDGHIHFVSGLGEESHWYRNLLANPRVVVQLPGRVFEGVAEPVTDPAEALSARTAILRTSWVTLLALGLPPVGVTEAQVAESTLGDRPVVRVRTVEPVEPGIWDPGSWGFALPHVVAPIVAVGLLRKLRRGR